MDSNPPTEFQWPDITIDVSPDCLHARAAASPYGTGEIAAIDSQYVLDRLIQGGVVFGLLDAGIERFIETWRQYGAVQKPIAVAAGLAPQPPMYGPPEPTPSVITEMSVIERLRIRPPSHYQDLAETVGGATPCLVTQGERLIGLVRSSPGRPGIGVDGVEIPAPEEAIPVTVGTGAQWDGLAGAVCATTCGLAVFDGRRIDVLPVDVNGKVEVTIQEDGLSASAVVCPPGPGGKAVAEATIREQLTAAGVKMGVINDAIEAAVQQAAGSGSRFAAEVAQGRRAQDGYDAALEYLVDMEVVNVPSLERGGRVDFKGISVICAVSAGQPLVRRHPGAKGVPGYTVTGKLLPAYNGREVRLPKGRHVAPDPADPDLLLASIDGHVRQAGGGLEVQECFSVGGDVDYSTGHITYDRSVVIKGDVKSGFNVTVGGDLEVGGLVEDCTVKAGGNILFRRGFVGSGQGLVESKGDILIGFGRNQRVRCGNQLTIEREAINMDIQCRNRVIVTGILVGGRVVSLNRVTCRTLGNESGTRTEIEIGVDYALLEQRDQLDEDIRQLKRTLYGGVAAPRPALSAASQQLAAEADLSPARIEALIKGLEDRRRVLWEEAYNPSDPAVAIQERIGPNVVIKIGNAPPLRTTEALPGPLLFAVREGEVRWA